MGTMPMIMASAVISTGRKRVNPASIAAPTGSPCAPAVPSRSHHQNAVRGGNAHAHDGAHQRRNAERCVRDEQEQNDPGQRRRQRRDDDERIEPRLEVHDDQQIDQDNREAQPDEQSQR